MGDCSVSQGRTARPSKTYPRAGDIPPLNPARKAFKWPKQRKRMRQGKSTATPAVEEKRWMEAVVAYGCIVCRLQYGCFRECEVHHLLRGGIRMGHLFTIGLCAPGHHRDALPGLGMVSRHPTKTSFERRYGTEMELLEQTQTALHWVTA
ncbi:MAG: hypothetical protein JWN23_1567 [Rhodocyclales bacterium]|nr:hypothetical protein [Rhodocyclales bacterium]